MKKRIIFIIAIPLLVCLIWYLQRERTYTSNFFALDTSIELKINTTSDGNKILQKCEARIRELENILSATVENSDVWQLNKNAGNGQSIPVHAETIYVLETAANVSKLTDGAFDITVGNLVDAWGFRTDNPSVPSESEIESAINLINYKDVFVDEENSAAKLIYPNQKIDLGGIAKGFIADETVSLLKSENINSALINLGGNTYAVGKRIDGKEWTVGIQSPIESNSIIGKLKLTDKAAVTSGDYQRYFEENGIRYHHILNPHTGYPAESGLHSVTIVTENSTLADAFSTACFVMGTKKSLPILNSAGIDAVFYDTDGKITATDNLKSTFETN
ncbi:MAG: FAD:protein FMN transferase [Clostridia bacterium]|nr:FAD:protein FMN transferase [Clostridia bacterium]